MPSSSSRKTRKRSSDDYVIAVRTYARSHMFPNMTYKTLERSGLTDRLYIFVANADEKRLYESALAGKPYKAIVIGALGGANATRAITEYFPQGKRIVFMDDDLEQFFEFQGDKREPAPFVKDSDRLGRYLIDGFETIDKFGLGSFTFSFYQNRFWLQDKPFKQFRPFTLADNFFGVRNDRKMIPTKHSHSDDLVRSCRYLDRYGGVLVYWWAGFKTHYAENEGGLAKNRGVNVSESLERTAKACWWEYNNSPLVRLYSNPPKQEKHNPFWSLNMKSLVQIRKILDERGIRHPEMNWNKWFSLAVSN
jgi:hypothetical protein